MQQKTADQPPYNLVFMSACYTAADASLANAFRLIGYTNRAFLGFSTKVLENTKSLNWDTAVCNRLQMGNTIQDAVELATQTWGNPDKSQDDDHAAVTTIHGVLMTKLHGVFLGESADQWYLPGDTFEGQ